MLKIIICEDNKDFMNRILITINKVLMPYNFDYRIYKEFEYNEKVEELIKSDGEKIYILDIVLSDVSGLEIASEIREVDLDSFVIFLTSHLEYKNDIFFSRLLAIDYIYKDRLWIDRLEKTIDYIVNKISKKKILQYEFNHISYRIPYNDIVYIEKVSNNQKCIIYTNNNDEYEIGTTIEQLIKKLEKNFFISHKSCIINLNKIKKVNYHQNMITFQNGKSIYLLSNRKKKEIRKYVSDY